MGDFKLTYFNLRARGELPRLIFVKSGTKFTDERIEMTDWPNKKASMPMGQMPVLNFKGQTVIQSKTIARFVARKCKLAGKGEMEEILADQFVTTLWSDILEKQIMAIFRPATADADPEKVEAAQQPIQEALDNLAKLVKGPFVLGKEMSYADLALFDFEPWLAKIPGAKMPENLKRIVAQVAADPKIAAYLAKRPETPF